MTEEKTDKKTEFENAALPHMNSLYHMGLYMTRSKEEAEDLVQDTYLRAYRAFDGFRRGTNCKAWLFKILRNLFINKYRKDARSPAVIPYEDVENFYLYNKAMSTKDISINLSREPERLAEVIGEEVKNAMEALPAEFKEVIILSDIEGFSYRETSKIVDLPVGTVKSRLYRARRYLQKKLWDYAGKRGFIKK